MSGYAVCVLHTPRECHSHQARVIGASGGTQYLRMSSEVTVVMLNRGSSFSVYYINIAINHSIERNL